MAEKVAIVRCKECKKDRCKSKRCQCTKKGVPCNADCGCTDCENPLSKTTASSDPLVLAPPPPPPLTRQRAEEALPAVLRAVPCPRPADATRYTLKRTDLVVNVAGTTADKPCGSILSWRVWWEQATDDWFDVCVSTRCRQNAVVGAHVRITGQKGIFIVPHCPGCNDVRMTESTNTVQGTVAVLRALEETVFELTEV